MATANVPTDPWRIREEHFRASLAAKEKMTFLVRWAVLAPSTRNTQPWRFRVADDAVFLYADRGRQQPIADPEARELHLSLGAALENLIIAGERFGYSALVEYDPDPFEPDLVASVAFHPGGEVSPHRWGLFAALGDRSTDRQSFDPRPIPWEMQGLLAEAAIEPGVAVHLTTDAEVKRRLGELSLRADAMLFADPAFRREAAYWAAEGGAGTSWLVAKLAALARPLLDLFERRPGGDRERPTGDGEHLAAAPVAGVVTSTADDRPSRLRAGQVLERLWLRAETLGLSLQPMSQALEAPSTREVLGELLPTAGAVVQQPFRLGFARAPRHRSPRRPLAEVLAS